MRVKLTQPYDKYWDDNSQMHIRKQSVEYEDNDEGFLLGFINRNTNYKIKTDMHRAPDSMEVTESLTIALINYNGKVLEVESKWIEIL